MNLLDVTKRLQTEDQCLDFLEKVRWPDGKIRCLQCGSDRISRVERKSKSKNKRTRLYTCLEPTCKQQFSPTVGTLFHDSHLPLSKWFAAVALIVHAKKSMSAKQMERHLGVNYRTAWFMGHRIRKAMADGHPIVTPAGPSRPKLSGIVEVDETYIGGKHRGNRGKMDNKEVVMGIRERGGELRFRHIASSNVEELSREIKENISRDAQRVITDELPAYPRAMMSAGIHGSKHDTIRHRDKIYVQGDIYTNTVESAFSLFKRGIIGSFHSVSAKHLDRYLAEFEYRFNRRKKPDLFTETLGRMVQTGGMKYAELIAE
jgi:transposase-like protein